VRVSHAYGMDVSFAMSTEPADGCSNNPGPYIRLAGAISLGGLNAQLRFSNNLKGTHVHTEDVTTTLRLVSTSRSRSRSSRRGAASAATRTSTCCSTTGTARRWRIRSTSAAACRASPTRRPT